MVPLCLFHPAQKYKLTAYFESDSEEMEEKSKISSQENWTAKATHESDALDLKNGVFTWN
jgi:hypothetical protein